MFSSRPNTPIVGLTRKAELQDPRSAIEIRFPRLARELLQNWFRPGIDDLLEHLILDDRSGRSGFPMEVIDELMFLADIRWHLTHADPHQGLAMTADREFLDYDLPPADPLLAWKAKSQPRVQLFWTDKAEDKRLG